MLLSMLMTEDAGVFGTVGGGELRTELLSGITASARVFRAAAIAESGGGANGQGPVGE